MNIIFHENIEAYHLAVAEINEDIESLSSKIIKEMSKEEIICLNNLTNSKRKLEWLAIRNLLNEMTGKYHEIKYSENGNPYIIDQYNISITHSKNIIGIILSLRNDIGIDAEIIKPNILNVAHKFINKNELEDFDKNDHVKRSYLHWCGKETLYKIKKIGGFDFKVHFKIEIDEISQKGTLKGTINFESICEKYLLNYQFIHKDESEILVVWH
jgi:phosphopantetheinyl transferase